MPVLDVVLALAESDCEGLRAGGLAQPANALSSLAFVAVGVGLAWRWRRTGGVDGRGASAGTMVAAGAMVAAGLGSFAYHGPQPGWAGTVHDLAVATLALVVVGSTVGRLARPRDRRLALAAWSGAAPWLAVALAAWAAGRAGSPLCHPDALWQPHALWHVLCAAGLGVVLLGSAPGHRTSRTPSMPAARCPGNEQ